LESLLEDTFGGKSILETSVLTLLDALFKLEQEFKEAPKTTNKKTVNRGVILIF
jgi:hypothetical protein